MDKWKQNGCARLCAFLLCAILTALPLLADAITREESATSPLLASSAVKPWLLSASDDEVDDLDGEMASNASDLENGIASEEEEPSVEDTALSQGQINDLIQNAALSEGETAEEYLEAPQGLPEKAGSLSILLIGVDNYNLEKAGRSDTVILATVDKETGAVKLISFLRDMYVKIPGKGMNRINAAYYYGGAELLMETLTANFGVKIDRYIAVDFSLMANIIDELGGITLTITARERTPLNNLIHDFQGSANAKYVESAGEQVLTGVQALCYSRIRKIDSDFQRVSRQHRVLEAIMVRVKEEGPIKAMEFATKYMEAVQTDLTLSDIVALLPVLLASADDEAFETMHIPLDNAFYDDVVKGMMVLMPNLSKNSSAIAELLAE